MPASEKQAFVQALLSLKNDVPSQMGLGNRYDDYIQMHAASMPTGSKGWAHGGPAFLPWHRAFLRRFELDLGVALPYWDWTVNDTPDKEGWPFTPDFLGGTGRDADQKVMDGPFAFDAGKWTLNIQPPSSPLPNFLTRAIGSDPNAPFPPSAAEVEQGLTETPYDRAPWGPGARPSFRDRLEGFHGLGSLHNRIHNFVAGHMSDVHISPSDPAFFLHHVNIDRLWAEWQKRHPLEPYAPGDHEPDTLAGHRLNDIMRPWEKLTPVTVASTLKYWEAYRYDNVDIPANDPIGAVELPIGMRPFAVPAWVKENVPPLVAGHHDHRFDVSPEDLERFAAGDAPPHHH